MEGGRPENVLTQHFEKRVMVHVLANIVKVVVFACTRMVTAQFSWLWFLDVRAGGANGF
jgi:hypothetical protein